MGRVQNKVALITCGASGIGLATARLFADEGAKVVLTDVDAPQFPAAATYRLDVTSESDWIAVTDAVMRDFGKIDIVVNSAGVSLLKDTNRTSREPLHHDWLIKKPRPATP